MANRTKSLRVHGANVILPARGLKERIAVGEIENALVRTAQYLLDPYDHGRQIKPMKTATLPTMPNG